MRLTGSWMTSNVDDDLYERISCVFAKKEKKDEIVKVIYNPPATIILWKDGTKTVVKCSELDTWDPEKGFAMAMLKKLLGESSYRKVFKKWVKPQEKKEAFEQISPNFYELMERLPDLTNRLVEALGSLGVHMEEERAGDADD